MNSFYLLLTCLAVLQNASGSRNRRKCHPAHGINNFHGLPILDFSGITNIAEFNEHDPVREVGAFNPYGKKSKKITADTPKLTPLATTTDFAERTLKLPFDPTQANIPIGRVGVTSFGSRNFRDRVQPKCFSESMHANVYLAKDTVPKKDQTVGNWAKITGELTSKTLRNGDTQLRIRICGGFARSIYSVWEVGCIWCMTRRERPNFRPAGGLPNVILTDRKGRGELVWTQKRNPFHHGVNRTLIYTLAYHWDYNLYGGAPYLQLFTPNIVGGYIAGGQIFCPLVGKTLIEAPPLRCYRGYGDEKELFEVEDMVVKGNMGIGSLCVAFVGGVGLALLIQHGCMRKNKSSQDSYVELA